MHRYFEEKIMAINGHNFQDMSIYSIKNIIYFNNGH
jgi:hypothetical protein